MTMQNMVDYLVDRGFKAEKRYISRKRVYEFTITKDGNSVTDNFEYPDSVTWDERNSRMRRFLDNLIAVFDAKYNTGRDSRYEIKDVIFNDPATIVFWKDGTKTVVQCQDSDVFDPEKGLTMAIVKKMYGNKGSYCNQIKKWTEPYYEKQKEIKVANDIFAALTRDALSLAEKLRKKATEERSKITDKGDTFKYDEPLFETRGDAEKCIAILQELIGTYGCATVADMYEASGIEDEMYYTMNKYGWTNIKDSKIYRTRHGYIIDLPRALPIETEESDA